MLRPAPVAASGTKYSAPQTTSGSRPSSPPQSASCSRAVPPAGPTPWRVTRQRAAVAGSDEARPHEPFTPTPFTSPLRHRSGTSTPTTTSF